jgi:type I restriction enzyme S subunit
VTSIVPRGSDSGDLVVRETAPEYGRAAAPWPISKLASVAKVETGLTPPTQDLTNYGSEYSFVSPADISDDKYVFKTRKGLSQRGFDLTRRFPAGSVLFVCIGSTIGKCAIATCEMTSNQQINAVIPSEVMSSEFVYYWLSAVASKVRASASEQAVPLISKSQFSLLEIPVPQLEEQRAIAEALGDVDALIAAQQKLVAKKRAIKTATMQRLLTGKQRLPGFGEGCGYKKTEVAVIPEDWQVANLHELLESARLGGNYTNSDKPTSSPLIKMGNIGRGKIRLDKLEYIPDNVLVRSEDRLHFGDVLLNTRNTLDLVGKVCIWRDELPKAFYNSNLLRLKFREERIGDNFFANLALNSKYAIEQLRGFATGTTSVAAIYSRDLAKLQLAFPSVPEQRAIAQVLTDMDAEITALEKRLVKTKDIKQGMMQELLTGRTRLV